MYRCVYVWNYIYTYANDAVSYLGLMVQKKMGVPTCYLMMEVSRPVRTWLYSSGMLPSYLRRKCFLLLWIHRVIMKIKRQCGTNLCF